MLSHLSWLMGTVMQQHSILPTKLRGSGNALQVRNHWSCRLAQIDVLMLYSLQNLDTISGFPCPPLEWSAIAARAQHLGHPKGTSVLCAEEQAPMCRQAQLHSELARCCCMSCCIIHQTCAAAQS